VDPPQRKPSLPRFATKVIEQNEAPQLVAKPVSRKQTEMGMPAPPPTANEEHEAERQSYDDIEQVARIDQLERERAQLLVKLQDKEQEVALLREIAPTVVFPPDSTPPPAPVPSKPPDEFELLKANLEIEKIEKTLVKSGLARKAMAIGIFLAIGWNAFNSYRARLPEKKVDGLQARVTQNEQLTERDVTERVLEKQRTLQALRAFECWGKQMRGGFQRQGLDLPALPAGGITVYRIGDEDPNHPGPPKFIATEKCPDFPRLPPEGAPR
jgi:hypothetical protein